MESDEKTEARLAEAAEMMKSRGAWIKFFLVAVFVAIPGGLIMSAITGSH